MFLMTRSQITTPRRRFSSDGVALVATLGLLAAIALTSLAVAAGSASAATFTVDSNGDTSAVNACTDAIANNCTLRAALTAADGNDNQPAADDIFFAGPGVITLTSSTPLPTVAEPVRINAGGLDVKVQGSDTYVAACGPGTGFALDLTNPAASGSWVRGLAVNSVCGRAIKSLVTAPTVRIGPRRGDGTLPVTGSGPATATAADIFTTSASLDDREAVTFKAAVPVANGSFSYLPSPEPPSDALYTATVTDPSGTSTFAARAAVPSDITSPSFVRAVATSQSQVRLDFDEPVSQGSLDSADFSLTMANLPRPVTGATAFGTSVFVNTAQPWQTGEGGYLSLAGSGAVTDLAGNEILGGPAAKVYAGPGDLEKPVIRSLSISPSKICRTVRKGCKRTTAKLRVSLSERARITTTVFRASFKPRKILGFRDKLEAGVSWVKIKNTMVGRRLPRGRMVVTVVAEDVARATSDPAETIFEVG